MTKTFFKAARQNNYTQGQNGLIISVFFILFTITLISCFYFGINPIRDYYTITISRVPSNFNESCILPDLNPFDSNMMKNIREYEPIRCKRCEPLIYIHGTNEIVFNKTYILQNKISTTEIQCKCHDVIRVDRDDSVVWSATYKCQPPSKVKSDFFKVICTLKGKVVYDNTLTAIFKNKTVKVKHKSESKGLNANYNVYLFGIDSMSRPVAMRQLKKTLDYLNKDLNAFTFQGYLKVGSNTFPNIIPLLTGRQAYSKELPDTDDLDAYPFIWKNFSQADYMTLYAEDMPVLNTFNIAGRKGFTRPPTDHYMRPFWLAWNKEYPVRNYNMGFGFKLLENDFFKSKTQQYTLCAGNYPNYVVHLEYLKQFIQTYKMEKKFIFAFNTELGHYNENFLHLADEHLHSVINWMNLTQSEDAIFIFFSDHGQKVSENYLTVRLEQNFPLLSIVLPRRFQKVYPKLWENMQDNTKKLTTHYDLYATLLDIVGRNFERPRDYLVDGKVRGRSLFGEISAERSCADAAIPEHLCICYESRKVKDRELEGKLADAVVYKLNSMLSKTEKCAKLNLQSIIDVQEVIKWQAASPPRSVHMIKSKVYLEAVKKYTVILRTDPGGGEFLATCKVHSGSNIEVLKGVDRINIYGNQSYCVKEAFLKPVCFCKS